MKYIWILKYILHCAFSRKNLVAAYQEGGALGCLLIFPFLSVCLILGEYNKSLLYFIVFLLFIFEVVITWDYDKVMARFHYFDLNKWKMEKEFRVVRWAILIDLLIFILSALYRTGIRSAWF
jgi:hypothetical protein